MEIWNSIGGWCNGYSFGHSGGFGMGGWMPFHFGGILQLVIIGLIVYFTLRMFRKPAPATEEPTIMELIKRRYASGEIDKETYTRIKNDLK